MSHGDTYTPASDHPTTGPKAAPATAPAPGAPAPRTPWQRPAPPDLATLGAKLHAEGALPIQEAHHYHGLRHAAGETPALIPVTIPADEIEKARARLARWLAAATHATGTDKATRKRAKQAELAATAVITVQHRPKLFVVTATLADGRVARVELHHPTNYDAGGKLWPWSWVEAPGR